ncbi:hypothetical protein LSH36_768g01003 [Paralvinella palmiformis]|uniref:Calx-beta domain-containing protein n=1 Tax=Paralvinella palmiformis TaxID=53620 RepID=A0AAD9J0Y8_9ANNE|nr:hypothetical protein LSH36_768g01003 [Paralvinella palmiformis]
MTETQYEAEEGQQIEIGLLRHGIAASSISVVIQIKEPHVQGGHDFIGTSQALIFPAGIDDLVKNVLFTVADDDIPEPDESFVIYLTVPNGDGEAGTPDRTVLTILANDDSFGIFGFVQVTPVRVKELDHDNELRLSIYRSRGTYGDVELHYEVMSSNLKNLDLGPVSNSTTFYSGENNKNIILTVYADQEEFRIEEADYDTSVSVVITRGLDDDGETIIGPISNLATVNYYLIPETASPGVDYVAYNNSVTFSPGITKTSFSIKILSDSIPEVSESFSIVLGSPSGDVVLVEPSTCTVMIGANDEPNGVLSLRTSPGQQFPRVIVNEDVDVNITGFTVQRSGGKFGRVSIDWVLMRNDSSPGDGGDVMPTVGSVVLGNGQSEQNIILYVVRDDVPEPVERYMLKLLSGSVQGGGRAEGVLQGELIIQDSDEAHGVVQFINEDVQQLITTSSPRKLMLSLVRSGGALGSLQVVYDVKYSYNGITVPDIFLATMPTSGVFPAGQHSLSLEVFIKNEAFLQIGATFTVTLLRISLSDGSDLQPYNTPQIGQLNEVHIEVSVETASGEVGFAEPHKRIVKEPEGTTSTTHVELELRRVGTNGDVNIIWSATGSGSNTGHVIRNDITPLEGTIMMTTGQTSAVLKLDILADDEPEPDEYVTVRIERVEPQDTQHIKSGSATIQLIIQENDNPGGVFHFAHQMALAYTVQRSGAALVSRQLQYKIEPRGEAEFYGDTNIITFPPGEVLKNITVLARGDGIPELTEVFQLKLYSFGNKTSIIDSPSNVNITILSNDQPYGYFEFAADNTTIYVEESRGADVRYAKIPVERMMGRFSVATVDWLLLNNSDPPDLQPSHGTLNFDLGVGRVTIDMEVIADDIPEGEEIFYVNLSNPTGDSTLGEFLVASVHILQNDDPIYFQEPGLFEVSEGGTYNVTVLRSGRLEQLVTVKYHTLDGSATEAGRDYVIINEQKMVFEPGEDRKTITFTILEDDVPEPDEVFYLELYDEEGDVAVFGPPAKIIIMSNDMANGIVHFTSYYHKSTIEGKPVEFKLTRDVGIYGQADVLCQIYNNDSGKMVEDGEDFASSVVMATFNNLDQSTSLWLTPLKDGIPEYDEVFQIVLFNVTGGRADDPGHLADYNLTAYLTVLENDSPFGLFTIGADSQEISVPEDVYEHRDDSDRVAHLSVERTKGLFTAVKVAWEIFSYQIAGAGSLPLFTDLLLVGQIPETVNELPLNGRQATGTKVLMFTGCQSCYVTVASHYHPSYTAIEDGFSLSAWIQPQANMDGYVIAKTSPDGATYYYAFRLSTRRQGEFVSLTIAFQYSSTASPVLTEEQEVNIDTADGKWHFVVLSVDDGLVYFYVDGAIRGVRNLENSRIQDGPGILLVGAAAPGQHYYKGMLQDVRIYSRKLEDNELTELYEMPSAEDLYPISGYLTFNEGQFSNNITIFVLDDHEEEANDVFTVKLISASGDADIEQDRAVATLTVLKSDNANGLFGFSAPCKPAVHESEGDTFLCPVIRTRGDSDTVKVSWQVINEDGQLAVDDFLNASGQIIFKPGERNQMLNVQPLDDDIPELDEVFDVQLVEALSADGLLGSTNTSGASVDPERWRTTITIPATDNPHGLLQFDVSGDSTRFWNVTWVEPLTESPEISIPEEVGTVSLPIIRAQGKLGTVSVEWRTIDGTARSSAKSPPDFVLRWTIPSLTKVDRIFFRKDGPYLLYLRWTSIADRYNKSEYSFSETIKFRLYYLDFRFSLRTSLAISAFRYHDICLEPINTRQDPGSADIHSDLDCSIRFPFMLTV